MTVLVHLYSQSQPMVHTSIRNTYQKGDMFCLMDGEGNVVKYPIQHIFRVRESGDGDATAKWGSHDE